MQLREVSTSRLDRIPDCERCGAGSTTSFNWQYAKTRVSPDSKHDLSVFVERKALRYGVLYRCQACGQTWYLFGDPELMNFVPADRLPLIERWNERPVILPAWFAAQLRAIGSTPPDIYGNGGRYQDTPCAVTTVDGDRIDIAVISIQRHAPFEESRTCRLATEIETLSASPHALPLDVRIASSQAQEVSMGFAPTLVETADGELVVLNWRQSFFVWRDCKASDVVISHRPFDWENLPPVYGGTQNVVHFVADDAAK